MVSKESLMKSHIAVRQACNDAVCAVEENPQAFDNLTFKKHHVSKPLPSSYRHMGFVAITCAGIMKLLGMGLH